MAYHRRLRPKMQTLLYLSEGHPCLISTPLKELKRTYGQIKEFCGKLSRTPYIYLTGGDPILHPDFWELLRMFKADGTRFCIMGNPFHLTDEVCRRMKECGCRKISAVAGRIGKDARYVPQTRLVRRNDKCDRHDQAFGNVVRGDEHGIKDEYARDPRPYRPCGRDGR